MLCRSGLSALDLMYHFIDNTSTHTWHRFAPELCNELVVVRGLLLLAEVTMGAARSNIVFCGDS
eukprot:4744066-Heterocapsa_arctica.AAC.1